MLETLSQLMLNRNFMVDLWVNFDCDPESEDVFERMVDFLTKVSPGARRNDGVNCVLNSLDQTIRLYRACIRPD